MFDDQSRQISDNHTAYTPSIGCRDVLSTKYQFSRQCLCNFADAYFPDGSQTSDCTFACNIQCTLCLDGYFLYHAECTSHKSNVSYLQKFELFWVVVWPFLFPLLSWPFDHKCGIILLVCLCVTGPSLFTIVVMAIFSLNKSFFLVHKNLLSQEILGLGDVLVC